MIPYLPCFGAQLVGMSHVRNTNIHEVVPKFKNEFGACRSRLCEALAVGVPDVARYIADTAFALLSLFEHGTVHWMK